MSKKSIECLENHPAQNPQIAVEMKTCSLFTNNVIDRELVSYMVWQVTEMTLVFIGPESDHWQCLSVTD